MAISEKTTLRHQKWKRDILAIIRATPAASRISVKRESGLSMDSTLSLVEELLQEELILTVGKAESAKAGRKATLLEINPQGAYFIGIRFSAEGISGALVDFSCQTVTSRRVELSSQPQESDLVQGILSCIGELIDALGENAARLRGIGLGAPGIIDLDEGLIVRYAHMPGIRNLPLRRIVEERFGIPVYLEHGVKCSARAALMQTAFSPAHDLLFMQTGRGVHMCVIIGGKIHGGTNYLSGEIGHMLVSDSQSVESLISSSALCQRAQEQIAQEDERFFILRSIARGQIVLDDLITAAARGCPGSQSLLMQAGEAAGVALASAIMIINPREVLLNGTLCASPCFERSVRSTLKARCIPESLAGLSLRFIASDPRQDATGAAMIPFHRQFSVMTDSEEL